MDAAAWLGGVLGVLCLLSKHVAMFSTTTDSSDLVIPFHNALACNPLRCKEGLAGSTATCGMSDNGDVFLFRNACDMCWFSCVSERVYKPVSSENCGADPTPTSTHTPTVSSPVPSVTCTQPATSTSKAGIVAYNLIGSFTTSK